MLKTRLVLNNWNNVVVVRLHRKGDQTNLDNYRPISLLSQILKLFTKMLTNRLNNKINDYRASKHLKRLHHLRSFVNSER